MGTVMAFIDLYESYVGKGAPSNAYGSRRGYGRTPTEAHQHADHWANQLPWARIRYIAVVDQERAPSLTTRDEEVAWALIGNRHEHWTPTPEHTALVALLHKGLFATAIRTYFDYLDRGIVLLRP